MYDVGVNKTTEQEINIVTFTSNISDTRASPQLLMIPRQSSCPVSTMVCMTA